MRLANLLHAIAYRVPNKKYDAEKVRMFVRHICFLLRKSTFDIGGDSSAWGAKVYAYLTPPVPEPIERQVWTSTKGGIGARDFWDICYSLLKLPRGDNTKMQDSHCYSLFVVASTIPHVSRVVLGGKHGMTVSDAFRKALLNHVPEALCQVDQTIKQYSAYTVRIEGSVAQTLEQYLKQLICVVRMPETDLHAAVFYHFAKWMNQSKSIAIKHPKTMSPPNIKRAMLAYPTILSEYLSLSIGKEREFELITPNDTTSITLDLSISRRPEDLSLTRIVQESTSVQTTAVNATSRLDHIRNAWVEAEFAWENP